MFSRRDSIKTLLGSVAVMGLGEVRAQRPPSAERIIDSHTHFYDPERTQGVPWPRKGSPLYRPVYPKEWQAVANPFGIRETVVIEASPWFEDNQWLLDLAAKENCIIAVIGNLDFSHSQFSARLRRLASNPLFRGLRLSGHALETVIAQRELWEGLKLMADLDLVLDVNGGFDQMGAMVAAVPNLRVVLDHVGSSGPPDRLRHGWLEELKQISAAPNVRCKVSALVEQSGAAPANASMAHYLPILDHVWQCFGPDRLLYGSNWPVSENGADYAAVFQIASEYFATKGQSVCEKFFSRNAEMTYKGVSRK